MNETQLQDALLAVAEKVIALRNRRDQIDRDIEAAKREQLDLIRAANGAAREHAAGHPEPRADGAAPIFASIKAPDMTLRKRILIRLAETDRGASTEEIAAAMGHDLKAVRMTLQDLRSKKGLIDKPGKGVWKINEKGRAAIV